MILVYFFIVAICSDVVVGERPGCPPHGRPPKASSGASASAHSSSSSSSTHSSSSSSSYASSSAAASDCHDFNRCNDRNATYKKCPNPCPGTCENPKGVENCLMMCPDFGCECNPGYVLSDNGKCILLKDCPDYLRCHGDRNATFKECPNPCPRTCQFPGGTGICSKLCLKEGCECKEGYYLNEEGKCVQLQDCPGAKTCSANETFVYCRVKCPNNYCPVDDSRAVAACDPPFPCESGCACKAGYLRVSREDDRCILAGECPPVTCTRQNEEWNGRPPPCLNERCADIGISYPCHRSFPPAPQCVCKRGFYRNDTDICVPEKECHIDKCNDTNATYKKCPNPCPGSCENPKGVENCLMMCPDFGCECNPGYVLSDNGKCILLKDCPDYLRCQGDRNATFKNCPNPCPPTCQYPGGTSAICKRICPKEGCECKTNYYLNDEGKCVQLQDCPGAKICSANETFVNCEVDCPNDYCPVDDSRAVPVCAAPVPCESGCACKAGYLRLSGEDGRCILASECPPVTCTRQNEQWNSSPPPCLNERCADIGTSYPCDISFPPAPQCVCKPGFYRNDTDICVPEKECPPKCGYNEIPVKCRTICPPQSCEISYTDYACGKPTCEPGCDCIPDHLRNASGICIPNDQCPPPPTIPTCGLNEELSSCKIVCPPQTCESIYTLYLCVEDIPCEWGCNCVRGYLRNSSGVCIPSEQCPSNPPLTCGYNEVPSDCKITCPPQTCESIFSTYLCPEHPICEPGCNCLDGYLRNSSGICVPSDECFILPECEIPSECRPTCANPDPQNCPLVDPASDNEDGCKCKPGYILSDTDGECIRIEECPADIGCNGDPNAIATSCPWPCPSTCSSPKAGTCGKTCKPVGCQCKPGYILSRRNGKCILPDKCKYGNPCGVNGTFADCAFRCPNQNCPKDDSLSVIACKPGRPCPSGCLCKEYYRRKKDDTCVLASDCCPVKCTRKNEVWNPCASDCLAENCADINQDIDCFPDPKNCQPKCVCCKGYYRNASGYCVPKKDCKPPCDVPPACRPTCAVPNPPDCPFITPAETNDDDCNCQQGYILSEPGGKCIRIEECPANAGCNGDLHAVVKFCPKPCPSTCDAPNEVGCKRKCDPIGCECEPGYLLSEIDGNCVLPDDCKGGNPCGPNATFVPCRYNCPSIYCPVDDSRAIVICETYPFAPCFSGCTCNLNHKRLSSDNPICIRSDECPPVTCTRQYEEWNPCPMDCRSEYCEEVDKPPVTCNTLVLNCDPRCVCKKDYFRNPKTDLCVSSHQCRIINKKTQKNSD